MIRAIDDGDYGAVKQLLHRNPDLANTEIVEGELGMFPESVLIRSIRHQHPRVAELLISKRANVNYRDWRKLTPLHYAAEHGDNRTVDLLMAHGANVNAKDDDGLTPIMLAVEEGRKDAVVHLMKHGAVPGSSIHKAAALGDLVAVIGEARRDPLSVNRQQNHQSPLSLAAAHHHLDIVRFLTSHGAKVDARAFSNAAKSGDMGVVRFLRDKVTDLDARDMDSTSYTALQVAAIHGHMNVVEYLLAEGADPTIKTQGFTTMELARKAGHDDIAKALMHHSKP